MSEKKSLHLILTYNWFDKIKSGEKTSEYREIKPHWNNILAKDYETVVFHRGYGHAGKPAEKLAMKIEKVQQTTEPNDLGLEKCWEIKLATI